MNETVAKLSDDAPLEDRLGEAALAAVMGDPYEVGLRIALDDGVAAALPAVARELAWLDAAVAASGAGLAGLSRAPATIVARPAAAAAVPELGADAPPVVARGGRSPADGFAVVERAAERMAAPDWAPRGPPAAAPMTAPRAAEAPGAMRTEVGPTEAGPSEAGPAQAGPAEVGPAQAGPAEAGRLDWGGTAWGRLAAVPGVPEAAMASAVAAPAAMAEAAMTPAIAASAELVPAVMAPGGPPLVSAAPAGAAEMVSAAPVSAWAMPDLPGSGPAWRGAATREPMAQAAPDEAQGSAEGAETALEGRLELDGAVLGRFVAEMLAREAGRPASGMTGFDPLVSPAWPGALQG